MAIIYNDDYEIVEVEPLGKTINDIRLNLCYLKYKIVDHWGSFVCNCSDGIGMYVIRDFEIIHIDNDNKQIYIDDDGKSPSRFVFKAEQIVRRRRQNATARHF